MKLLITISPRKSAQALGLVALVLAVVSIAGKTIEDVAGTTEPHAISQVVRVFNINREASVPTWYAEALLLLAAFLVALIAYLTQTRREAFRRHWSGLAVIFLYLSMDEAAEIHEKLTVPLQESLNATGPFYFAWVYVGIPFTVVVALLYLKFLLHLPPRTMRLFLLAGFLYAGAALGIEGIGANKWWHDGGSSLGYSAIGTTEEFVEMLGVVVFIYALLDYLNRHVDRIQVVLFSRAQEPALSGSPRAVTAAPFEGDRAGEARG